MKPSLMLDQIVANTFAETRDYGKFRGIHAGTHEQDEIFMPRFPKGGHLLPERLKGGFIVHVLHVQYFDGNISVPTAFVHWKSIGFR